jgi:cytochrome c biogenesis protein CcmG, thiol:disulfide interchange protein DsbE
MGGWRGGGARRGRLSFVLLIVVAALVVGLSGKRATVGRPAPALPTVAVGGPPVTLAALLGAPGGSATGVSGGAGGSATRVGSGAGARAAGVRGRHAALVLFWASDCEPCQREASAVGRFARSPAGRGRIAGVDYGESESAGPLAFLRRYHWSFPNLSDPDGRAGEAYGVTGLPSTFVIDAHGRISATLRGPQTVQSLTRALAAAES